MNCPLLIALLVAGSVVAQELTGDPVWECRPPNGAWTNTLPATVAFGLWEGAQLASLVGLVWLTGRLLGERLSRPGRLVLVAAVAVAGPVFWSFIYAQAQLPLAALVLAAFYWHRQGRVGWACAAAALAGLVKL